MRGPHVIDLTRQSQLDGAIFAGCPGRRAMEQLFPGSYLLSPDPRLNAHLPEIGPEAVDGAHRSYAPPARCRRGAGPTGDARLLARGIPSGAGGNRGARGEVVG